MVANEPSLANIERDVLDADFGLPNTLTSQSRVLTLSSCSCQFLLSTGLPRRHIICLHILLQKHEMSLDLINLQWRLLNSNQEFEVFQKFLSMPTYRMADQIVSRPDLPRERYALLCSEFRNAAELASNSEVATAHLRSSILAWSGELRHLGSDKGKRGSLRDSRLICTEPLRKRNCTDDKSIYHSLTSVQLSNPSGVSSKGRPKQSRQRSSWEMAKARRVGPSSR